MQSKLVKLGEKFEAGKYGYYDAELENGLSGKLVIDGNSTPPIVGNVVDYNVEDTTSKSGKLYKKITLVSAGVQSSAPSQPGQPQSTKGNTDIRSIIASYVKDEICFGEATGVKAEHLEQRFERYLKLIMG